MIGFVLGLLLGLPPQASSVAARTQVIAILAEREGDEVSFRFVLNGPVDSYSASREGDEVVVRFSAEAKTALLVPVAVEPIRSLSLGSESTFSMRVSVPEIWSHEMLREFSSLRLILRRRGAASRPAVAEPSPPAQPSPEPGRTPEEATGDTADLYRRLFPSVADPNGGVAGPTALGTSENWYSDFAWLGLQIKPWVSVTYVDGETTQVESSTAVGDTYWVVQPNLGIGISPNIGRGEGRWRLNYSPRFRRLVDLNFPSLTSHFFDAGIDQTVPAFGSIYGTYHYSRGILETEEVDPGREYGIGLNKVTDTTIERFRRSGFGLGVRFEFVADTQIDINASTTSVKYGNDPTDPVRLGPRAFFSYDTRTLTSSLRRGLGEGRFLTLSLLIDDTPAQKERKQIEGRGYSYNAAIDGDIAALTTGRVMFGYRTQKNPNAGLGGQSYKDVNFGAQLVRQFSEDWNAGLGADRKLYLSAFEENGFYVADSLRGDVSGRLPLGFFIRGSVYLQSNNYKASPQLQDATLLLRKDKLRAWTIGLSRNVARWAYLRADYAAEHRNSNLNRFDINTRALTIQLGLGFFGKPEAQAHSSW